MANAVVDYTSRDFDSIKESLLRYAQTAMPNWVPGSEGDFGVLLLELVAYVGDINSYYIDRAQNEAYLPTATQKSSILNIAQELGYVPGQGSPAKGTVTLVASDNLVLAGAPTILVPAGFQLATDYIAAIDGQIIFETDVAVSLTPGQTVDVAVTEGQTQVDPVSGLPLPLGDSTGSPAQEFKIPKPRVYVDTVQVFVAGSPWRKVTHLLDADSNDQVFETYTDADGYTWVRFGDALNGSIPGVGLPVTVSYRTGYGALGNVGEGLVTTVYSTSISGVSLERSTSTSNLSTSTAMVGGSDPEGIEQIRTNAPKTFFTQQRAVTLQDFENFALGIPGVGKAYAVADYFSSVTVFVIGSDGNPPTTGLLDTVATVLQSKALAGVSVNVAAPTAVPVNVGAAGNAVAIQVWPTYSRANTQYAVEQAIKSRLSFLSVNLGERLTVADLYKIVMDVPGVRYAAIPLMARADSVQSDTADIQFQPFEYPSVGNVVVTSTGGIG